MARPDGIVIAIDGSIGSGKSSTARAVAEKLGYLYIDTGAMYCALTLKALRNGADLNDEPSMAGLACRTRIELIKADIGPRVVLDGVDVSEEIRSPEVTRNVAPVADGKGVRRILVRQQRKLGKRGAVVMDGRDIGTVVFPDAELNLIFDADLEVRAKRRYLELSEQGVSLSLEEVRADILERDCRDATRDYGPETERADGVFLDTTHLTLGQQVQFVLDLALQKGARKR